MDTETEQESLTLKWGTIKGWGNLSDKSQAIMQRYADLGMSLGAMQQVDTPEQKAILCELIDAIDGPIENDWEGTTMTKEAAKEYVLNYRR
jgi:hypothetical protein